MLHCQQTEVGSLYRSQTTSFAVTEKPRDAPYYF